MATLLLIAGALPPSAVAQTSNPAVEDSIRLARGEWNRAIETRDTAALRALLSETYHSGSGFGHILGADSAVIFAARLFARRPDVLFQTRATRIRVLAEHGLASEFGEWVERWREPSGHTELRGTYYALWRRQNGRWLIEAEVNTPESCAGSEYCKPR
jgi:hypothetical protein